jgi:hypothetical protein
MGDMAFTFGLPMAQALFSTMSNADPNVDDFPYVAPTSTCARLASQPLMQIQMQMTSHM